MRIRTLLRLPLGELLWRELKGAHLNVGWVFIRCVVGCAQQKELERGSVWLPPSWRPVGRQQGLAVERRILRL